MASPITIVTAPPTRIRVSLLTSSAREKPITATDCARNTTVKPSTNSAVAVTALPRTASDTRWPEPIPALPAGTTTAASAPTREVR